MNPALHLARWQFTPMSLRWLAGRGRGLKRQFPKPSAEAGEIAEVAKDNRTGRGRRGHGGHFLHPTPPQMWVPPVSSSAHASVRLSSSPWKFPSTLFLPERKVILVFGVKQGFLFSLLQ